VNAAELLAEFRGRGVELFAKDGGLRFRAAKGALTPEMRQAVTEHRADLLALLSSPPAVLDDWDVAAAAAELVRIADLLDAAMRMEGVETAQCNVVEVFRALAQRYATDHDPVLWDAFAAFETTIRSWCSRPVEVSTSPAVLGTP
jgi:hypothetical protein